MKWISKVVVANLIATKFGESYDNRFMNLESVMSLSRIDDFLRFLETLSGKQVFTSLSRDSSKCSAYTVLGSLFLVNDEYDYVDVIGVPDWIINQITYTAGGHRFFGRYEYCQRDAFKVCNLALMLSDN